MRKYTPRATPASQIVAVLLSVGLLVVAVIAARELWTKRTGTELRSWLTPIFELISRAHFEPWMLPFGVFLALVGLLFMFFAIKPRPQTHQRLAGSENMWIRNVDVARLCTGTAQRVPGVATARTYASPRLVSVTITGNTQDDTLVQRTEEALGAIVSQLEEAPRLSVHLAAREER